MTTAYVTNGTVVELPVPVEGFTLSQCYSAAYLADCVENAPSDVAVGWTYNGTTFAAPAAPTTPAPTQSQLFAYAQQKVLTLLSTPRPYTVTSLSGQVVDDCGLVTAADMNAAWTQLSSLTYPYSWSDDNFTVWSMTQAQLTQFLTSVFAYGAEVWALMNGTAIPEIKAGTVTTYAEVDALAWPT